jgi:hypothetical protein
MNPRKSPAFFFFVTRHKTTAAANAQTQTHTDKTADALQLGDDEAAQTACFHVPLGRVERVLSKFARLS